MDERSRKRTSMWDLKDANRNLDDSRRENVRGGEYRASSNEYKSYSDRHSSAHVDEDNAKYPKDAKDVRTKYEPDVSFRDRASGNRSTWRHSDRDNKGFSEGRTDWAEDESRRDNVHSPKSSWQRPARSRGKSDSRSRSRSPVRVYKHESVMNDRHRSRVDVPIQTCRDFASGRCRTGSHCPFLHPSTQNFEDRRYDYEHKEVSYRGGNYSQYNDYSRDTSESTKDYDRNNRGISFNHGADREPRRSADIPCTFFAAGNCRNGKFCRFSHQIQIPRSSGERARGEKWENVGQGDSGTKFSDTVDPHDERWRKNHSPEKIGQVDPGTEFSNTVSPCNEKWKRNHSPEKIGQVDRGSKFSATEYGKEGKWRTNGNPDRVGQIDRSISFSENADPHVVGQGKDCQGRDVSSSMSCRPDNSMTVDFLGHGPPTTMDKSVKVEANQSSKLKSDRHSNTFKLKGVVDWIEDKMSPEWNPKVASSKTAAEEDPAYPIHTSDSVVLNVQSHEASQCLHNVVVTSEMTANVEKVNPQQSSYPINGAPSVFSYEKNVGSQVATNFNNGFLSGNYVQSSKQDVQVGTLGNLNAAMKGEYSTTPNFPGNEHASIIRTSMENYEMSTVKTNCEDLKTSEETFEAAPASTIVGQAHLTDLSASLAHLLGKGEQLPQLYTAINHLNAVSSVETSNTIASQLPVESVQPHPPIGYQSVSGNAVEHEHAHHHPNPGMLSISKDVKQETPSAEQSAGEGYKNGYSERKLDPKPDMDCKPETNPPTIHVEGTKLKDKQAELREGSPLREGKVDVEKKVKDTKALRDFKHALVNFVKELLKPAWKDGQIDKEGHKTIVKKVVDKVTGTIQETSIPQTPEKVDHYLSSSKPKLTKLVQAYVDRNPKKQV